MMESLWLHHRLISCAPPAHLVVSIFNQRTLGVKSQRFITPKGVTLNSFSTSTNLQSLIRKLTFQCAMSTNQGFLLCTLPMSSAVFPRLWAEDALKKFENRAIQNHASKSHRAPELPVLRQLQHDVHRQSRQP
jgi:hypothetical protein